MRSRVFVCDICKKTQVERKFGDGFPGWGSLHGKMDQTENGIKIQIDEIDFCQKHFLMVMEAINQIEEQANAKKEVASDGVQVDD